MDFGALISTSWEKLDKENYPLRECLWFQTEGEIEKKSKDSTSRSQAHLAGMTGNLPPEKGGTGGLRGKLLVFLHESHKSYWSSLSSSYEPFLIEPTGSDDRRTVQDYFSATFGLEVSVRPSF